MAKHKETKFASQIIKTIDDDEEVDDFSENSDEEVEVSSFYLMFLTNF